MLSGLLTLVYNEISYSDVLQIHDSVFGFFSLFTLVLCVDLQPAYMFMHRMPVWHSQRPKKGIRFFEIGVTDSCDGPCGCWELNSCPLKEQSSAFGS